MKEGGWRSNVEEALSSKMGADGGGAMGCKSFVKQHSSDYSLQHLQCIAEVEFCGA